MAPVTHRRTGAFLVGHAGRRGGARRFFSPWRWCGSRGIAGAWVTSRQARHRGRPVDAFCCGPVLWQPRAEITHWAPPPRGIECPFWRSQNGCFGYLADRHRPRACLRRTHLPAQILGARRRELPRRSIWGDSQSLDPVERRLLEDDPAYAETLRRLNAMEPAMRNEGGEDHKPDGETDRPVP
jgi:hypothetical protein